MFIWWIVTGLSLLSKLSLFLLSKLSLLSFFTARKVSKYEVFSGPYFSVFSQNTGKYGPEITMYLDTFHVVSNINNV